jgi:hypothetical protein
MVLSRLVSDKQECNLWSYLKLMGSTTSRTASQIERAARGKNLEKEYRTSGG